VRGERLGLDRGEVDGRAELRRRGERDGRRSIRLPTGRPPTIRSLTATTDPCTGA
jgi:hypothetical protein